MGIGIRDLPQRKAALDQIEHILDPAWTFGMILPAYVGAETDARLRAIRHVLSKLEEE